ncbi:MAG: carbon starvation protein A [Acidobacteria bacterium]|nr:MAG: carbon starvation protein A [Acidobacteriota bacterium]
MNTFPIILLALAILAIGYRYYSKFLATKVLGIDETRKTPAHTNYDGQNYYPMSKWVLFGHHFAGITGAGPLIGPVLAAQFGFLPGLIWLVLGVVLAGAVQDFVILFASVRQGGKSLAEIARKQISGFSGFAAAVAILFVVIIAEAGLGLAVVNALADSPWGTFTIGMTIPLALIMGLWMYKIRPGVGVREATIFGVVSLILAVVLGRFIPGSFLAPYFTFTRHQLTALLALYALSASVLPVWLLLAPRDYLSTFMKIATICALILGVFVVHPDFKMPALTRFTAGGGPIVPGPVFPFAFITIACGAISGFHSLIASGTTPKMLSNEGHMRPIGYGSMLMEGVVGLMALVAATSLFPGDYFAINTPVAQYEANVAAEYPIVNLPDLSLQVGENVQARTGGAVSLAVGMAQIFTGIPGMRGLMSYWYHFAIMFEALFILTTIDAGTRVTRFIVQEFVGKFYPPFARTDWLFANVTASLFVVLGWGYFIWTGSISTIWPMFGIANQLLASVALCVGTSLILNSGRAKYWWVTVLPLSFLGTNTLTAGYLSIRDNFWPLTADPATATQGYVDSICTATMMVLVVLILLDSLNQWRKVLLEGAPAMEYAGD